MLSGIVLIITGEKECSVPQVIAHLQSIGQPYFRLDTDSFFDRRTRLALSLHSDVVTGSIQCSTGEIDLSLIKSVWCRRPKNVCAAWMEGVMERQFVEDEVSSSLWSLYTSLGMVFWMNHPLRARYLLEHNKLLQMKIAASAGLTVPDTIITNDAHRLIRFCEDHGGGIAVKAVRSRIFQEEGGAVGIYTNKISTGYLKKHIADITLAPVMAQEYVKKEIELRITVVGHSIFTCAIHSQDSARTKDDWRRYDFSRVKHEPCELPSTTKNQLLAFMKKCGLTFGAIDMILTPAGEYVFLEVNPSGQFGWIENLTGLPISESIAKTLSAPPLNE